MSQQMVGIVMNRLLTDEDLRIRFTVEPVETLADLQARGFELTPDEIDLFIQTDPWTWFWTEWGAARPPSTGPLRIKQPS